MGEQYPDVEIAFNPGIDDSAIWGSRRTAARTPRLLLAGLGAQRARDRQRGRDPHPVRRARRGVAARDAGEAHRQRRAQLVRVRPHASTTCPANARSTTARRSASFRLVTTPYALDPPLPPGGDPYTALPNPLPGLWYVGQGAFTHFGSHATYWGYDLHKTDNALHPETPIGSGNLADNFSFGQPILAPVAGTVYSLANDKPDHPPYDYSPRRAAELPVPRDPGKHGAAVQPHEAGHDPLLAGQSGGRERAGGAGRALGRGRLAAPALRSRDDPRAQSEHRRPARDHERKRGAQPHGERSVAPRRGVVGDPRRVLRAAGAGRRARARPRCRVARASVAGQARARLCRRARPASSAAPAASPARTRARAKRSRRRCRPRRSSARDSPRS